jgi:two-component system, NtrC family, response regulator AtoC
VDPVKRSPSINGELRATNELPFGPTTPAAAAASWYLMLTTAVPQPTSRLVSLSEESEIVVGRGAGCDVVIDFDGVSRRHARFARGGQQVFVEDLGSMNGTLVNGAAITGQRRLAPGDVITLGTVTAVLAATSAVRGQRPLATVTELEERLDIETERARRYGRNLGLLMLRITGPGELVESHVQAIVRSLRRMDLLADYGGDELALLLPEADRAALDAVLARVRSAPKGVDVECGSVAFPTDQTSVGEMIGHARARLHGVPDQPADQRRASTMIVLDPKMQHVMSLVERVASSPITVLLYGESGVGKDVVAEAIHAHSPRAQRPFVRLDCGALPDALLESELFGHVKGAFTDAIADKPGQLERAHTGTLFLDGIGELPPAAQAKLLRVLEQRKFLRVGAVKETTIDVRVICATHHDLEAEVKRSRFREDLFFRISAFAIPIPPLRDRRAEIAPLAARFAAELFTKRKVTFDPAALRMLEAYDWPGNVRELRNAIERALVLGGARIEVEHLPERVVSAAPAGEGRVTDMRRRVASVERQAILDALLDADGKQNVAARALGISRFALSRLLDKHDIKRR